MQWIDGYSGRSFRVTTQSCTGGDGVAKIMTLADVLVAYRVHTEPKSLGPNGEACDLGTRGLLQRRPVTATRKIYIGKESNKLDERDKRLLHNLDEAFTEYPDPHRDPFTTLVLPVLRDLPASTIAKQVGLGSTTVKKIRAGRTPQPKNRIVLTRLGSEIATKALRKWRIPRPDDDLACCYAYLEVRKNRGLRRCRGCQKPLRGRRTQYCSAACKQRAYRERSALR
jgi:hypothetical protein